MLYCLHGVVVDFALLPTDFLLYRSLWCDSGFVLPPTSYVHYFQAVSSLVTRLLPMQKSLLFGTGRSLGTRLAVSPYNFWQGLHSRFIILQLRMEILCLPSWSLRFRKVAYLNVPNEIHDWISMQMNVAIWWLQKVIEYNSQLMNVAI